MEPRSAEIEQPNAGPDQRESLERELSGRLLLLYDGVCGLCNRTVQFTLKRDRKDRFRFAPLQSDLAVSILMRHGRDPADLDSVYLVEDPHGPSEKVSRKSKAIFRVLGELGGPWTILSWLGALPAGLLDLGYNVVARFRYRWFGRYDACPIPSAAQRKKFLGL
jgi:predicted DCC family thiol-disulfide oxidoreductase YuxK